MNHPKITETARFCGNCDGHNCYDYPTKIFCSTRHAQGLDPIVDTLWYCSQWNPVTQSCYCVIEAQKAQKNTNKEQT
ncbi:MAG: hypothetical protein BWY47_01452 [Bacteroidetes bacterium ADurb.Bin302]|nr:MAG: hypothetical protein BWY47_01452 [Bacteroidetes bacterium ADurb.Bin302]